MGCGLGIELIVGELIRGGEQGEGLFFDKEMEVAGHGADGTVALDGGEVWRSFDLESDRAAMTLAGVGDEVGGVAGCGHGGDTGAGDTRFCQLR